MDVMREVAVVTGAASGIGRATAEALSRRGAYVGLIDIDSDGVDSLAAELGGPDHALPLLGSVADEDFMASAMAGVAERLGRLDTVVANAGIAVAGAVDVLPLAEWNRSLAITLTGTFLAAAKSVPYLRASSRPAFVAVASDAGFRGAQGLPAYAAAKHAVVGLVRSMAADHGPEGIRVNAVCPGWVRTPILEALVGEERLAHVTGFIPLGRIAEPEDVAEVILHLSDPRSRSTHGSCYVMDGGETSSSFR